MSNSCKLRYCLTKLYSLTFVYSRDCGKLGFVDDCTREDSAKLAKRRQHQLRGTTGAFSTWVPSVNGVHVAVS